ncbi:MAG: helix-turn-helix domain-containing protein [Chloroflexi bacterium]|nr:helix-turn-helix domain-containing protein [Chloroflexota bacterium]
MVEESGRSYITPAGAAQRLGISPRRVYELAKANRLVSIRLGGRLLITAHSVDALAGGGERVGRPLSPRRAWGLILLASGEDPRALDPVTKSKLRRMLRERDLWSIRARLSGRATKERLRAHPSDLRRIEAEPALVRTGPRFAHDAGIQLVASDATPEYYVDPETAASLIGRYRLSSSSDPNVILRVVPAEVWPWLSHAVAPRVAVALDVAEDGDARSRNAAQSVLAR